MKEANALRAAIAVACLVPLIGAGVIAGSGLLGRAPADHVTADSHLRYQSGLLLGIGFVTNTPAIERQGPRVRLLIFLVVVGGLGRLGGLFLHGAPEAPMLFGPGMELVGTPAL